MSPFNHSIAQSTLYVAKNRQLKKMVTHTLTLGIPRIFNNEPGNFDCNLCGGIIDGIFREH
jgi:hypothetical protein